MRIDWRRGNAPGPAPPASELLEVAPPVSITGFRCVDADPDPDPDPDADVDIDVGADQLIKCSPGGKNFVPEKESVV